MWRVVVFLFIMLPFSAFAECVSVDQVTKCARLPTCIGHCGSDDYSPEYTYNVAESDGVSWSYFRDGIPYSGTSQDFYNGIVSADATCLITSPVLASVQGSVSELDYLASTGADVCAFPNVWEVSVMDFVVTQLEGDVCPDGFYTVPYEISCGEGLVEVADIPYCDTDTTGDNCLISNVPAITPCAAGITTLRTGTGVSIPLWAERGTEPSLCVKYNDMVCYANLELGQATNSININYNNLIYHLVD